MGVVAPEVVQVGVGEVGPWWRWGLAPGGVAVCEGGEGGDGVVAGEGAVEVEEEDEAGGGGPAGWVGWGHGEGVNLGKGGGPGGKGERRARVGTGERWLRSWGLFTSGSGGGRAMVFHASSVRCMPQHRILEAK